MKISRDAKEPMQHKRWSVFTVSLLALLLGFCVLLTYIFDPFFQYHKPFPDISYQMNNQLYHNPGIVKHFSYDALLVGSSMVESFETSWFEPLTSQKIAKVPSSGASMLDMRLIIELALSENPALHTIYWGFDTFALFTKAVDELKQPFQAYLYDNNIFNDAPYVFNKTVLFQEVIPSWQRTLKAIPSTTFDEYTNWNLTSTFGLHTALDWYRFPAAPIDPLQAAHTPNPCLETARQNLEQNVLPLIEANSEVDFIIFDPPYSILYWYDMMSEGQMGDMMEAWEYATARLLAYDNVKYHIFDEEEILTNLYHYRDYIHYTSNVSKYVVQNLFTDRHLITRDNFETVLAHMNAIPRRFDYSIFKKDTYPLFQPSTLKEYLRLLTDERYSVLITWRVGEPARLSAAAVELAESFGLSPSATKGYLAAVSGQNILLQKSSDDDLHETVFLDGHTFHLNSSAATATSSISMDSLLPEPIFYTKHTPGLQLVVFDKEYGRVVDNRLF